MLFGLVLAGLLAGQPVAAQYANTLPSQAALMRLPPADQARAIAGEYARCVAQRHRRAVDRALSLPFSGDWSSEMRRLTDANCLEYQMLRFSPDLIRGALFGATYRLDYARAAPALATAEAIDFAADGSAGGPDGSMPALRRAVDCGVRAAPGDARAIVLADVASPAETRAYAAWVPHLANCLPHGSPIRFSRTVLGGMIAEMLYRNTRAAASASAPTGSQH